MEGRRPPGRPKKTWTKVVEEDMRMLNVMEEMVMDSQQWRRLTSCPTLAMGTNGYETMMMMMMMINVFVSFLVIIL